MNINEKENLFLKIEKNAQEFDKVFQDLSYSVSLAMMLNLSNKNRQDRIEFTDYLDFAHGSSIETAYSKCLGKIAVIDYFILKHCRIMKEAIEKDPKEEKKQTRETMKKIAETIYDKHVKKTDDAKYKEELPDTFINY